ncbi:MAG: hypothetical protein H6744_15770 [Deltaproteobacteria bacterium]|nr:hypothetical protein [Deltaproteobacteria bacterium]MCB9788140.1 hypothetical protein [Deltaproteobacteria bacterium]
MFARISLALTVLVSTALAAGCGDDGAAVPGSITADWKFLGTSTCSSLNLASLEMTALQNGEVQNSVLVTCPATSKSGSISLGELPPGRYTVQIDGIDVDGKATHTGSVDKVPVVEGTDTKFDELKTPLPPIELVEKPTTVLVDWDLGGKCSSSGVEEVQVTMLADDGSPISGTPPKLVACDNEVVDPEDPEAMVAGVLFENLSARRTVLFYVEGRDSSGNVILDGESDPLPLRAGEVHRLVVTLAAPSN